MEHRLFRTKALFSLSINLFLTLTQSLQAESKLEIALFGDSLSRGTIADNPLGSEASSLKAVDFVARNIYYTHFIPVIPDGEGATTTALMEKMEFAAKDHLAYLQGTAPYSIKTRLKSMGIDANIQIYAMLGGSYRIGDTQLAKLEHNLSRGAKAPDIVMVDLGRIDFAFYTNDADFKFQVERFFERLTSLVPQAKILVNKIANFPKAYFLKDSIAANIPFRGPLKCSDILKGIGLGRNSGIDPANPDPLAYAKADLKWQHFNSLIQSTVDLWASRGYRLQTVQLIPEPALPDVWDQEFTMDCIHFNQRGHGIIAYNLWPTVRALLDEPKLELPSYVKAPQSSQFSELGQELWREHVRESNLKPLQEGCEPAYFPAEGTAPRGVVVLYHGFSACPQQFFDLVPWLNSRGFHVLLPLNPGHGRAWEAGPKGAKDDFSDLATGLLSEPHNYRKVYGSFVHQMNRIAAEFRGIHAVGGLSLGGALASMSSVYRPDLWDRQLIMVPHYEISQPLIKNLYGSIHNLSQANSDIDPKLRKLLKTPAGWGGFCEAQRSAEMGGRAGICQFLSTHVLATNQIGFEAYSLLRPTLVKTQFVLVEQDMVVNNALVTQGVARMRREKAHASLPGRVKERYTEDPSVRVCYLPSKATRCIANLKIAPENQPRGCINHSLLSRADNIKFNQYWIDILEPKIGEFLTEGNFLTQDQRESVNQDPHCAGF